MFENTSTEPLAKTTLSLVADGCSFSLQYSESGEINLSSTNTIEKGSQASVQSLDKLQTISTTAEDCSWNVYATKKPLSSFHTQSRANVVDTDTTGRVARIGNKLYFLDKLKEDGTFESFVPTKFSLSLDEITKQGRYLVVTSRQKVTDVPTIERDPPKTETKAEDPGKPTPDSVETKTGKERTSADADTKDKEVQVDPDVKDHETKQEDSDTKAAEDKKADSDSEPEPEDDPYEVSNSEDELSAYESWSEGSTDLEEIGVRAIQDLRPEIPPVELRPKKNKTANGTASDEDTSSDDSDSDSDRSCSCCHSDSDESVVNDGNERFESQAANDEEETYRMYDAVYNDDRDDPYGDDESNEDDDMWDEQWKESGWALFGDDDDFDNDFKQFDDNDSDDCSDCGGDDGVCVLLGDDKKPKADKEAEQEEGNEPPLGSPMAQINVYDTLSPQEDDDKKPSFKRLFRYQASIMSPLSNSPPVMHPTKSLLVWPLGDSKVMLADYRRNTYFVKRLRLSRLFSQHVSVNCQFSPSGEHLHVIALERYGKPPLGRKEMLKLKKDKKKEKKEKEVPVYDLVLSTYRVSKGKTARAPPVLIHQTKHVLGPLEEKYALPTYTWTDKSISVTWAIADRQAEVREIQLFREAKSQVKVSVVEMQTDLGGMQIRLLRKQPRSSTVLTSEDILVSEVSQVRPFYKLEEVKKDEKSDDPESKAPVVDPKAAAEEKAETPEVATKTIVEETA